MMNPLSERSEALFRHFSPPRRGVRERDAQAHTRAYPWETAKLIEQMDEQIHWLGFSVLTWPMDQPVYTHVPREQEPTTFEQDDYYRAFAYAVRSRRPTLRSVQ
jgi:hypothetical protein